MYDKSPHSRRWKQGKPLYGRRESHSKIISNTTAVRNIHLADRMKMGYTNTSTSGARRFSRLASGRPVTATYRHNNTL